MSQLDPLKLYFVLNSEDATCEKPKELYTAYRTVLAYKGNAQWVTPSFCLRHEPEPKDVFVFDKFEGRAFEKLKRNSAKIIGARVLQSCMAARESIPPGTSPIFTEGMRGFVICFSGLNGEKKKRYQQLVEYMGGVHTKELRSLTNYVVAHNNISIKAIEAYRSNIPIMKEEWVEAVWEKSQQVNIRGDSEEFASLRSPLFHNLKISLSAMTAKDKELLREGITQNGGIVTGTMEHGVTDILIVPSATGEKYKHARQWKIHIVRPIWVLECIKLKRIVKLSEYEVSANSVQKSSTPTRGELPNLTANFSYVSAIDGAVDHEKQLMEETSECSTYHFQNMPLKPLNTNTPQKTSSNVGAVVKQICTEARMAGTFLDGCNIYLAGFNQDNFEKLKRILNNAGATRFDELTYAVTHVLVEGTPGSELRDYLNRVVPLQWLLESAKMGKPVPVDKFVNNEELKMAEPPSPLSQQGAKLLSQPEPKKLYFAEKNDSLQLQPVEEDLLPRYNLSELGEPLPQPNSNEADIAKRAESPEATLKEESFQPDQLFIGLRFLLSSDLTDDESIGIETEIVNYGGQVVSKNFHGIPDYAVVPIIVTPSVAVTARNIVNILYIKDCCLANAILPLQYYHHPIAPKEGTAPLQGCVISGSQYVSSERDFVETLIEALGAVLQSSLTRRNMKGILKTTHLVCAEPTGQKYNGAIRWGLPVVNHNWLLKCAEMGYKVSEEPYLVGESKVITVGVIEAVSSPRISVKGPHQIETPQSKDCSVPALNSVSVIPESTKRNQKTPKKSSPGKSQRIRTPLFQSDSDSNALRAVHSEKSIGQEESNQTIEFPTVQHQPIELPNSNGSVNEADSAGQRLSRNERHTPLAPNKPLERLRQTQNTPSTPNTPVWSPKSSSVRLDEWMSRGVDFFQSPVSTASRNDNRRNSTPLIHYLRKVANSIKRPYDESDFSPAESVPKRKPEPNMQSDLLKGLKKMREIEASISPQLSFKQHSTPVREAVQEAIRVAEDAESQPQTEIGWDVPIEQPISATSQATKKFMFSGLGDDVDELMRLVENCGGVVSEVRKNFDDTATHLIIGSMTRSEKLLASIAAGLWVLHPSYLDELRKVKNVQLVYEEDHEWGNPKKAHRYEGLNENSKSSAISSYLWRRDIHIKKLPRPFFGLSIILNTSKEKYDSFKRLLEAGHGKVITNLEAADRNKVIYYMADSIDRKTIYESYAKQGIMCLNLGYINSVILRKPNPVENNIQPEFAEVLRRFKIS